MYNVKIKLLHIIDSLGKGGAETLLINSLAYLPYENHLIYLNDECKFEKSLIHARLSCFFFNNRLLKLPFLILRLRKYIKKNEITHIHAHLFWSIILARLACPSRVKLFFTLHNIQSLSSLKRNWARQLERRTFRKKDILIAVSHEVLNDYKTIVKNATGHVVYNFIDPGFFSKKTGNKKDPDTFRLIAIGTLKPQKNYEYMIQVFQLLKKKDEHKITLDIYGDGPLRKNIENLMRQDELNIELKGTTTDLKNLLPQYDAFIMSSLNEGCPLSVWEAMASGLPALLSDIPVFREVSAGHAVFFDTLNPEDCCNKILEMKKHPGAVSSMKEDGMKWVSSVAQPGQYVQNLSALYNL